MLPSGFSSSTPTTTHADPPRKATARKTLNEGGRANNGSSRAKVTKGEEDDDDADKGDKVSPRFVSVFAAAACVITF